MCGLTLGDYLLWNWALSAGHDVLALVSGLTLPALAIASMWLLAINLAGLIARSTRSSRNAAAERARARDVRDRRARHEGARRGDARGAPPSTAATADGEPASAASSRASSSGKLAA